MYEPSKLAERIKNFSKLKKIPMRNILETAGLGKNVISHLTEGSMLKADNLAKIADVLDCSIDYLLGRTDNPEVNK